MPEHLVPSSTTRLTGPAGVLSIVQRLAAVPSLRLPSYSLRTMRLPGDRPTRACRSEKGYHLYAGRPLQ